MDQTTQEIKKEKEEQQEIKKVYIPSITPAVVLLVFWLIYSIDTSRGETYSWPTNIAACLIIYGVAYFFTGGKVVKVRKIGTTKEFNPQTVSETSTEIKQEDISQQVDSTPDLISVKEQEQVTKLKEYLEKISTPKMKESLKNIIEVFKQILEYVNKNPEQKSSMNKILAAYIPTLIDLLEVYDKYENIAESNDEMKKTLTNIEDTTVSVEVGLKKKFQDLLKNETVDVNANIAALKTLLNQDGLLEENTINKGE